MLKINLKNDMICYILEWYFVSGYDMLCVYWYIIVVWLLMCIG